MTNDSGVLAQSMNLYRQGRLPEAERLIRSKRESDSSEIELNVLLGVILVRTKRYFEAIELLGSALVLDPLNLDVLNWLATANLAIGAYQKTIGLARRTLALDAMSLMGHNNLGRALLGVGDLEGAINEFKKALSIEPKSVPTIQNFARALAESGDHGSALAQFRTAIQLAPSEVSSYIGLFTQCEILGEWEQAKIVLESGLVHNPDSVQILIALAKTLGKLGELDRAKHLFAKAQTLDPRSGQSYALWLQENGEFERSVPVLLEAIKVDPKLGFTYYLLAEAKAFDQPDGSLLEAANRTKTSSNDPRSQMFFCYARAKTFDSFLKDYEPAMAEFDEANSLAHEIYRSRRPYDPDAVASYGKAINRVADEQLVKGKAFGNFSDRPILITGMIRAGTTLLDQIVTAHSKVGSAGELGFWQRSVERNLQSWSSHGLSKLELAKMAEGYLVELDRYGKGSERVTDKMPLNFQFLGLIHAVLPNGKILHIRRSPIDTCLSIYMTHFGSGPPFAYSKRSIVDHYRHYLETMEHWRSVLPASAFLEIDYEALILDREREVKRIIDFLGLPWEETCLHHERSESVIMTPSRWQARQPVYRTAIDRWKRYEPWLGTLLELQNFKHPPV